MLLSKQSLMFILPGCLKWRGGEERVFSVCCPRRSCPSPRHPVPHSGSDPGRLALPPCPCVPLGAGFQSPGSPWAPSCALAPGTPGSPSHRHSPPCIYYKHKQETDISDVWMQDSNSLLPCHLVEIVKLTSCHSQNQNRW